MSWYHWLSRTSFDSFTVRSRKDSTVQKQSQCNFSNCYLGSVFTARTKQFQQSISESQTQFQCSRRSIISLKGTKLAPPFQTQYPLVRMHSTRCSIAANSTQLRARYPNESQVPINTHETFEEECLLSLYPRWCSINRFDLVASSIAEV